MQPLQRWMVFLFATSNLLGCGGNGSPTAPTVGDFPLSGSGCPYDISGLGNHVVDPTAGKDLFGGDSPITAVAFHPHGSSMVIGLKDGSVQVWERVFGAMHRCSYGGYSRIGS